MQRHTLLLLSWLSFFDSADSPLTAFCRNDGDLLFADIPAGEALLTQGAAADGVQEVCRILVNGLFAAFCAGPHRMYHLLDHGFLLSLGFGQAMEKLLIHLPRQAADRFLDEPLLVD